MSEPPVSARREFFEQLYVDAEAGGEPIPWDRDGAPQPVLAGWAAERRLVGGGRRAVVVGCGLGGDAEFLARLGFDTVGFDYSGRAVEAARRTYPASPVEYAVADLLDLPASWAGAYDLVVESLTVQSVPRAARARMVAGVRSLVAPGGTLLVISGQQGVWPDEPTGPWPLSRAEVESFGADGLELVRLDEPAGADGRARWRAEFSRAAG